MEIFPGHSSCNGERQKTGVETWLEFQETLGPERVRKPIIIRQNRHSLETCKIGKRRRSRSHGC